MADVRKFSIYLPAHVAEAVRAISASAGRPVSEVIANALIRHYSIERPETIVAHGHVYRLDPNQP